MIILFLKLLSDPDSFDALLGSLLSVFDPVV